MQTADASFAAVPASVTAPYANARNTVIEVRFFNSESYVPVSLLKLERFADCQQVHWPEHKLTCRSLEGGQWRTVKYIGIPPRWKDTHVVIDRKGIKFKACATPFENVEYAKEPPPNIHGDKPFLVRLIQWSSPRGDALVATDRHYSLLVQIESQDQPEVYEDVAEEVRRRAGDTYACWWAKRVGEWELSICIDRKPSDDVSW